MAVISRNKNLLRKIILISGILSLISYCSIFISTANFWIISLINLSIPLIILINAFLLIIVLFLYPRLFVFPLAFVLAGSPFIASTYTANKWRDTEQNDLSVLSFNTKFFRKKNGYNEFSTEMIKWTSQDSSDIKCLQEYSTNSKWEPLDATKQISSSGYYHYIVQANIKGNDHNLGMAIFSKYPIIDSGYVWKKDESFNNGIYVDIKRNSDTLRIYNVHLTSMRLNDLKKSTIDRSNEIKKLVQHIRNCSFPYILGGDFNDVPFSYNYFQLKNIAKNSFEKAGQGFGFTYNGTLFFLRIDHQFYSPDFDAIKFIVDKEMNISDHYPTRGIYRINKNEQSVLVK